MATKEILTQGASNKPIQFAVAGLVLATGAYFLVKKFGRDIIPSKEERLTKDAELEVSAENPWSFTQFLEQKIPAGTPLLKVATAQANAKQIYDALNTYVFDSPDVIIGLFNSYKNKTQVALVAQAFYNIYKKDILTYLKNGNKTFDWLWFNATGGVSTEDYQRILTIVSKKSKF